MRTSPSLLVRFGGIVVAIGLTELLKDAVPIYACLAIALVGGFATAVALHMATTRYAARR